MSLERHYGGQTIHRRSEMRMDLIKKMTDEDQDPLRLLQDERFLGLHPREL